MSNKFHWKTKEYCQREYLHFCSSGAGFLWVWEFDISEMQRYGECTKTNNAFKKNIYSSHIMYSHIWHMKIIRHCPCIFLFHIKYVSMHCTSFIFLCFSLPGFWIFRQYSIWIWKFTFVIVHRLVMLYLDNTFGFNIYIRYIVLFDINENWYSYISKMPKRIHQHEQRFQHSYILDFHYLQTFVRQFGARIVTFVCLFFLGWKAETASFFFFWHFQERVRTPSELYEQVSFGCMFMIGFARLLKFYGILVALAKKDTKVKLPVWETTSQRFAQYGKGKHLPEFVPKLAHMHTLLLPNGKRMV